MAARTLRLVMLFMSLLALPLAAMAADGQTTEAVDAAVEEGEDPAEPAPEGRGLELHLQAEGLGGRAGVGGQLRADVVTDTDARLGLTGRWLPRGDQNLRGDLGVDLLGGGRAHFEVGGFAGVRRLGVAPLQPELGPQLTLGWTADDVFVDGTLRGAWVPEKGARFVLEQEVTAGLHLGGPAWIHARWVRLGVGQGATDAFGAGFGVVF